MKHYVLLRNGDDEVVKKEVVTFLGAVNSDQLNIDEVSKDEFEAY